MTTNLMTGVEFPCGFACETLRGAMTTKRFDGEARRGLKVAAGGCAAVAGLVAAGLIGFVHLPGEILVLGGLAFLGALASLVLLDLDAQQNPPEDAESLQLHPDGDAADSLLQTMREDFDQRLYRDTTGAVMGSPMWASMQAIERDAELRRHNPLP